MKIKPRSLPLICSVCLLIGATNAALASNLHFRPVGDAPDGTNPVAGGSYLWDTTLTNWYSAASGGTATAWNNSQADTAIFERVVGTYTVNLATGITVGGISTTFPATSVNPSNIILQSLDLETRQTLNLSGATINNNARFLTFQNLNVSGNFTHTGSGLLLVDNSVVFTGRVTVSAPGTGGVLVANTTSANAVDVYLTAGSVSLNANAATIVRLSGTTGNITRSTNGAGGTLTLNQTQNTTFGGRFANSNNTLNFTKDGAGTFIMNGSDNHQLGGPAMLNVTAGSFYLGGSLAEVGTGTLNVASGATFGGTVVTSKTLILGAANSIITPGMATLDLSENVENHAGVLTLANGITGANGGTFNFYMDEDAGGLVNSLIDITGGTVTLAGTKTVNLFGLNAGLLQTGVAYTLFDADGAASRIAGWDLGWTLNGNTTGLDVDSFGFVGNELQVVFVPEPATGALILLGALALAVRRRRPCASTWN